MTHHVHVARGGKTTDGRQSEHAAARELCSDALHCTFQAQCKAPSKIMNVPKQKKSEWAQFETHGTRRLHMSNQKAKFSAA